MTRANTSTAWDDPEFAAQWNSAHGLLMERSTRPTLAFPLLKEKIGEFEGKTFLELGCGNGNLIRAFQKESFAQWTGIDGGSAIIESAYPLMDDDRIHLERADITKPLESVERDSVDDIVAICVIEEIPLACMDGLLTNVRSSLKQTGQAHFFLNHPAYAMIMDHQAGRAGQPNVKYERHRGYFDVEPTGFTLSVVNQQSGATLKPPYHHKTMAHLNNAFADAGLRAVETIEIPQGVTEWGKLKDRQPVSGDWPRFLYMRLQR